MAKRKYEKDERPLKLENVDELMSCANRWTNKDKEAMRIVIKKAKNFDEILNPNENDDIINVGLDQLILQDIDGDKLLDLKMSDREISKLSDFAKMCIQYLKMMQLRYKSSQERVESEVTQMALSLLTCAGLNLKDDLCICPGKRRKIEIDDKIITSTTDLEIIMKSNILLVMSEKKDEYKPATKHSDTQLACALLTAAINNKKLSVSKPKFILGLKFIGPKVFFYRADITEDYLKELSNGFPKSNLDILKYPVDDLDGLSLLNPNHRFEILKNLTRIEKHFRYKPHD